MIEAAPRFASLDAAMIRRVAPVTVEAPAAAPRWPEWREDLRLAVTAYLGGLIFFLILLS